MQKPLKPAEFAEKQLVEAILDNTYAPGDALPAERILAEQLGVTRPTLRETLQRLSREGWVTIAHGKATRVNDYRSQGGLGVLTSLSRHGRSLSPDLVAGLLEVRCMLLPDVAQKAARQDPDRILACLETDPAPLPDALAAFDWSLQMCMVETAGNPIIRMIFNDFTPLYQVLGGAYFAVPAARDASLVYYRELAAALAGGNPVRDIVADAMARARTLWMEVDPCQTG